MIPEPRAYWAVGFLCSWWEAGMQVFILQLTPDHHWCGGVCSLHHGFRHSRFSNGRRNELSKVYSRKLLWKELGSFLWRVSGWLYEWQGVEKNSQGAIIMNQEVSQVDRFIPEFCNNKLSLLRIIVTISIVLMWFRYKLLQMEGQSHFWDPWLELFFIL